MTTDTPRFVVRRSHSAVRALLLAAFCTFIITAFLVDVQRGATSTEATATVQLHS